MSRTVDIPWVVVDIQWVVGRYTMGRGFNIFIGRGVDIPRVEVDIQ